MSARRGRRRARLAAALRWIERGLFTAGLLAAGWYLFVRLDAGLANARDRARLHALIAAAARHAPGAASVRRPSPPPPTGTLIGRLDVPRVDISAIVRQGDTAGILRLGAGHIPGTALPGRAGNVGVAGHRDTIFRPLRHLRAGDRISLTTPRGTFRYRVAWTKVVAPSDIAVLDPTRRASLTLVTCYPFYFIGHAPHRFVVRAVMSDAGAGAGASAHRHSPGY